MGRRRWVIPAGAVGAALLVAAMAGIIGGTLLALREGDRSPAKASALVTVFLRDSATSAQMEALVARIKAAPGVETYEYFSKEETRLRILDGRPEAMLTTFATAASYAIRVKNAAQAYAVAQQFFDDPAVNSDPGTHNGVMWWEEP
jgi:cell division protein FtsX